MKHVYAEPSDTVVAPKVQHEVNVGMQSQSGSQFEAIVVHRGERDLMKHAAEVLAISFTSDPMMRYLQRDLERRRSLQPFFTYAVRSAVEHGSSVTVAYTREQRQPVAASIVDWPGTTEESLPYLLRNAVPSSITSFGVSGFLRAKRGSTDVHDRIETLKEDEGNYAGAAYLGYVGVVPEMRGTGAIKHVTKPSLDVADQYGIPMLLVSSNPDANHDSFSSAGYVNVFDEPTHYDNGQGPANEYMVRAPRPTT